MAKIFPHVPKFDRFTSLGSYPLFYVFTDKWLACDVLCPDCATEVTRQAHLDGSHRTFAITADVNWEDPDLYCDECSERIESAYAEPEICAETGYCDCACRDCMEIAIGTKGEPRPLCNLCEESGCDATGQSECSVEPDPEEMESEAT